MAKYKVVEVRHGEGNIGIILQGKVVVDPDTGEEIDDGFAVWIPKDNVKTMKKSSIIKMLEGKIRDRAKMLRQLHQAKKQEQQESQNLISTIEENVKDYEIDVTED